MAHSQWHKTIYFHDLSVSTPRSNETNESSTVVSLLEIAQANDRATIYMHQGLVNLAIKMLSIACQKLRLLTHADYAKIQTHTSSIVETLSGQATASLLLQARFCEDETSNLFTNSIRLRNSGYMLNLYSISAVVHFNMGLARHIQALEALSKSSETARAILQVASRNYQTSISAANQNKDTPMLVRVAALCNLSECFLDTPDESSQHREQFIDALADLDSQERTIFTNGVSSTANAA